MTTSQPRRGRAPTRLAAVAALLVAAGCSEPFGGSAIKEGELGSGYFFYLCVGDSDFYCDEGGQADDFPEAIAVGSRFDLGYNTDLDGTVPRVEPGSASLVTDGPGLYMARAGYAVVLATRGFGDVIDLLHIVGRDVERFAVFTGDSQELVRIELQPGERLTLEARPQDDNRTTLAGSLDYTWASDDEAVFQIASADLDETAEIEGVGPGTAMLSISAGGFTTMIEVAIGGVSTDDTTSDSGDTEATDDAMDSGSGDAGSDSGDAGSDSGDTGGSDSDSGDTGGSDSDSGSGSGSSGGTAG